MDNETNGRLESTAFVRSKLYDQEGSSLQKYGSLVVGSTKLRKLISYEFRTFFGPFPGAIGLVLRKLLYPGLFGSVGKGTVFGRNVILRHPQKIHLGRRVYLDDGCIIDARGAGEEGITIGDDVIIGRRATIQAKVGSIHIGSETTVGENSVIASQGEIRIDEMVNIAGGCYISGGVFQIDRDGLTAREHEKTTKGPIQIDRKARIGMRVTVLDAVHIGEGCIVGAASLVNQNLPAYGVAAGAPAKVLRKREEVKSY